MCTMYIFLLNNVVHESLIIIYVLENRYAAQVYVTTKFVTYLYNPPPFQTSPVPATEAASPSYRYQPASPVTSPYWLGP